MTDVFYSVSPFGTGDIKTGSGNVEWTSGVATTSVAQTGNIGVGCAIVGNSITVYISAVNSSTSFDVVTVLGATPGDQGSTTLTSINYVWAGLADAESTYLGASFLNTTDLVTNQYKPYFYCYTDGTNDATNLTIDGATTNATYFLTIKTPDGGAESLVSNKHNGVYSTTYFYMSGTGTRITINDNYTQIIGLQIDDTEAESGFSPAILINSSSNAVIDSCVVKFDPGFTKYGIYNAGNAGVVIKNSVIVGDGTISGTGSKGIYVAGSGVITAQYCTVYNCYRGLDNSSSTLTAINCIVFGCTDDFNGTITITYCASDDGDGTNAVTFSGGSTDYDNIFNAWATYDFTLLNFTGSNAVIAQGVDIPAITDDIIGISRSDPPDIGAFEFAGGAPTFDAILKRYNGSSWEKAKLQRYNGSAFEDVSLKYFDTTWKTVDTTGV